VSYICPKCGSTNNNTYKHPNAKVWCIACGFTIRDEGALFDNPYDPLIDSGEKTALIALDLPDDAILKLALEAHKKDITLNEYINRYLRSYIEEAKIGKAKEVPEDN